MAIRADAGITSRCPRKRHPGRGPPGTLGFQAINACGNGARAVLPKGHDYGRNTCYRYKITPTRYKVPAGGATGKYGKDVRHLDGHSGWNRSPRIRRAYVPPNSHFQLTKNRSVKWSGAVSAHGVKLGASTQYDRDHKQRITAGGRTYSRHDIWGKNDRVDGKPGVFYSY
ncbi:hypothetical protein [Streptomyces sp. NPDC049906]|uniref:hypothetical protein n=1 Tax=Streptomyces sp. NPDC049906 TaxID=3155656 RepID=UPI00342F356F